MASNGKKPNADLPAFGVPLAGTLVFAKAYTSQRYNKAQLMVTGVWENAMKKAKEGGTMMEPGTEAVVFFPWKAAAAFARAGLIMQDSADPTKFLPLQGQRMFIRRDPEQTEGGHTAHNWTAQAITVEGEAVTLEARPEPKEPPQEAQEAQSAQPAAQAPPQATNAAPAGPGPAPGAAPAATPGPAKPAAQEKRAATAAKDDLAELRRADAMYKICASLAIHSLMWLYRRPRDEIDVRTVQAGCATIMRNLERGGFQASHQGAATMRNMVDALDAELRDDARVAADIAADPSKVIQTGGEPPKQFTDFPKAGDDDDDLPF